ncbi:MAG: hypothetical protein AAF705_06615 [Bacteroidota bacterium]
MRNFKLIFLFGLFVLCFTSTAQAQVDDTLPPWFRRPMDILTPKIIDWNSTYVLQSQAQAISKSNKITVSGKSLKLPRTIKILKGPITVKRGNNCYQISCERNRACNNCMMLWKDLNNDRKIQPKRELRCTCPKSGDNCGLRARKVECK